MDAENTYDELKRAALLDFPDIILSGIITHGPLNTAKSLRLFMSDGSFLEIWLSGEKYSYHWQRLDGSIYRHDNAPHKKHRHIMTFPKHFHDGSESNVKESNISSKPLIALHSFLEFVELNLKN
ncbi:MAG TPA: DUF6516 family protein [Candidatus Nanoarchaeia archaeon]|nr:DUF6516 family protein [Candidatus Nanoarchaeia archaeon]